MGGWVVKKKILEIQPDLVCELLTSMAHAAAQLFWSPPPWAQGRGQTVKYQKISITKSISKIISQTLCVFSQMKDIKHIRRDFHSVAWVIPQGSDLGVPWGVGWSKKFFFSEIQPDLVVSYLNQWHMQRHNCFGPYPPGPWGGTKRSNNIESQLQSQFQRFLN